MFLGYLQCFKSPLSWSAPLQSIEYCIIYSILYHRFVKETPSHDEASHFCRLQNQNMFRKNSVIRKDDKIKILDGSQKLFPNSLTHSSTATKAI